MKHHAAPCRTFACWIAGSPNAETHVAARSAGQARYRFMLDVRDVCPDLKITQIRCRSLGSLVESKQFRACMTYRRVPFVRLGMRVKVAGHEGEIVGHNCSANLNVLTTDDIHGNATTIDNNPLNGSAT